MTEQPAKRMHCATCTCTEREFAVRALNAHCPTCRCSPAAVPRDEGLGTIEGIRRAIERGR